MSGRISRKYFLDIVSSNPIKWYYFEESEVPTAIQGLDTRAWYWQSRKIIAKWKPHKKHKTNDLKHCLNVTKKLDCHHQNLNDLISMTFWTIACFRSNHFWCMFTHGFKTAKCLESPKILSYFSGTPAALKFFVNYILRLHKFFSTRRDISFILSGFRFAGRKLFHVIGLARIKRTKENVNKSEQIPSWKLALLAGMKSDTPM